MREPQIIIATGARGVGKTYKTCKLIEEYLTPNLATGKKARKVLIFDVNGEYTNEELAKNGFRFKTKVLALHDLEEWSKQKKIEVRRILPSDAKGNEVGVDKMPEILNIILHFYRGGLLLLEDINKYLVETKDPQIVGALIANRHKNLDIYIHLQSLSPLTTRMWQNANVVRFHYQMDSIDRYRNRIPNYELFKIAQLMVNRKYLTGEERFYCYVYSQKNKIKGRFSKKDFIVACREYLSINKQLVKIAQIKYGTSIEANIKARKECIRELYIKYYGNEIIKLKQVA